MKENKLLKYLKEFLITVAFLFITLYSLDLINLEFGINLPFLLESLIFIGIVIFLLNLQNVKKIFLITKPKKTHPKPKPYSKIFIYFQNITLASIILSLLIYLLEIVGISLFVNTNLFLIASFGLLVPFFFLWLKEIDEDPAKTDRINCLLNIPIIKWAGIPLILLIIGIGIAAAGLFTSDEIYTDLIETHRRPEIYQTSQSTYFGAFGSSADHLYSVSLSFDTEQIKETDDVIGLRLKPDPPEKPGWYFQRQYNLTQFADKDELEFNFPAIEESKNKQFVFEIDLPAGKGISEKTTLTTAYQVDKQTVTETTGSLISHTFQKLKFNVINHPFSSLLIIFLFPLFYLITRIYHDKSNEEESYLNIFTKNLFLILLLIITISSFDFILFGETIAEQINLTGFKTLTSAFAYPTIFIGMFTFCKNRHRIETEIEAEQKQEKKAEQLRAQQFPSKFPRFSKIPLIKYFLKLIHKTNWTIILVTTLFVLSRFILPLIYKTNTPDEFLHMASGKALLEEGRLAKIHQNGLYNRGFLVSFLVYISFLVFGISFYSAKLVPILLSIVSFYFLYKIGKKINLSDKIIFFLLLAYTLNPLSIFNHYTVRMYILYETFFITIIYILLKIQDSIKNLNLRKLFINIFWIAILNAINWFGMFDTGKYVLPLVTLTGFATIFVFNDNFSKLINKKINFSPVVKSLIIFGLSGTCLFLFGTKILIRIHTFSHHNPTPWDYNNLFFTFLLPLTTFTFLGLIIGIIRKNTYKLILGLPFLVLLALHLYSSLEIHHWRSIAYLMPLYLLLCLIGLNYFEILFKKHIGRIAVYSIILFLIITSYQNLLPQDYFIIGPTLPEFARFSGNVNMVSTSKFINENFDDNYIILEALRGYNLPSPRLFNIPVDYKVDLNNWYEHPHSQRSIYYENSSHRPIYMDKPVITEEKVLLKLLKSNNTIFITSEEVMTGNHLYSDEHFQLITDNLPYSQYFTGVWIFWQ